MSAYALVREAILYHRCLSAVYEGYPRHFSPHALGKSENGETKVFGFQYGGESQHGLPPGGEWRCFALEQLSDLRVNDDRWRSRDNYYGQPYTCVKDIDVEIAR